MKIEIDIDEKFIPNGYEVVGFRVPKKGEYFLSAPGAVMINLEGSHHPQLILKKKITFPSSVELGSFWVSKDNDGGVYITAGKPHFDEVWVVRDVTYVALHKIASTLGINIPDPFEGKEGGPDCLAYWDADKGELTYHGEGE